MAIINILGVPHAYELTAPTQIPHVLVFIHGWLLSREYWQPLIERLSPTYQCLSYDLRGFGDSKRSSSLDDQYQDQTQTYSRPPVPIPINSGILSADAKAVPPLSTANSRRVPKQQQENPISATLSEQSIIPNYTSATYAQDLEILLQELNISSAWLVGHSLGGSVALWSAARLGFAIKGVICMNWGGGIYLKEEFERFRAVGQRILKFRPSWLVYLPLVDMLFSRINLAGPVDPRWGRQRVIDFVKADPEAALGALLDSTTEAEVHLLPQVVTYLKQPAYFIAGSRDLIMEPKYVHHLASFHRMFQTGINVIEIPNCGHMAMIEHPAIVANQMQAILEKHA